MTGVEVDNLEALANQKLLESNTTATDSPTGETRSGKSATTILDGVTLNKVTNLRIVTF